MPQANAVNKPTETGKFPRHRKPENHSFANAGPNKGMHIKLQAKDIS